MCFDLFELYAFFSTNVLKLSVADSCMNLVWLLFCNFFSVFQLLLEITQIFSFTKFICTLPCNELIIYMFFDRSHMLRMLSQIQGMNMF